ncbi:MAG: hypothetical protein U9N52_11225, partial [Campylobacterota bacterium]|nr:hypothetical protein [Campylobacterota bacterium]
LSDGGADISGFSLSNTETFSISNQGVITTKKILDYEDTFRYELNASATNSIGQSDSIAFNIYVNNMIDVAAVLEDTEVAILENASPGDVAGTIRIITTGDSPITAFALGGVGSENFDVSNAGVISLKSGASLNYNADKDYFLTALATNSLGDSNTVDIKISVIEYFTPFQIAKLRSQNSSNFPRFGSAVSMSGDYIVVGAYGDDTNENHIGKVHLFKRQLDDTLIELNFPDIHDSIASDNFGWSLSIDGDYIVVGAKNKDTAETGSAYVYRRFSDNNIALIKKIQHSDSKANDNFGYAVSISGDYISIGAINDDTNATNAGSVYLYKKDSNDTITQLSKLYASDAQAQDLFGYSLSMDQGYLVVGALHEDSRGNNAGSAYLYKIQSDTNITQIAKIQPSDIEADDYFANAVSMDGDFIVVGAIGEDTTASHAGSVYLFKRNSDTSVTQIAKIQAKDPTTDNAFGSSVSIKGVFIAVGAIGDDSIASGAGSAYLFKIKPDETLVQIADKLTAHDAEANDNFGNAIAIDGDYVVVGAYREDTGSQSAGSAYVFNVEPEDKIYIYAEPADQININESFRNSSFILDAASPSGAVSYTLSGIDEGEMVLNVNESIVPHNAILSFLNVSDYELPSDIGVDNSYEVDILLSDQNDVTNDRVMHKKLTVFDRYFFDIQRIEANDPDINDYFGSGVSMSGDMIAISAPSEDTQGFGAGSVYIYKKNSNHSVTLVQKLQANDIEQGDAFGSSVDMDSEYLVIGAKYEDETAVSAGAVYLYKKVSTGKFEQFDKLMGKSAYEYFGASVAIHDDNVIIGAPGKDDTRGVAYHYNITDQNLTSYFHQPRDLGDSFGYSVGISGDYFTVGAIHEDSNGSNAGSAYLFKRGNTTQIKHLYATDAEAEDLFGYSVGMNGNYILIGAKDEDSNGANAGSAYLFKRENDSNITQIAKIQSDDIQANDNFGSSVSINSDYIVVGAMGEDSTALDSGSVYIFKRNSDHDNDVTQMAKIQALHYGISDSDNSDSFGVSVDIDNDNIIVGAHGRDTTSIKNSGAAYLYKKDPNQP